MGLGQAVQQVAGDVASTAKAAVTKSATQIAKTPLEMLEAALGSSPGGQKKEAAKQDPGELSSQIDPEDLKKREKDDDAYSEQESARLRAQINQTTAEYQQHKAAEEMKRKQAEMQKEQQRDFDIKRLEKQKKEDFALRAAKDASSAEKRVGAG